jgi:hypothetical protein
MQRKSRTSDHERQCRPERDAEVVSERLLYPRAEVARLFGISVASVIRLEATGVLSPIKLGNRPSSMTFYRAADVRALAEVKKREVDDVV